MYGTKEWTKKNKIILMPDEKFIKEEWFISLVKPGQSLGTHCNIFLTNMRIICLLTNERFVLTGDMLSFNLNDITEIRQPSGFLNSVKLGIVVNGSEYIFHIAKRDEWATAIRSAIASMSNKTNF